MGPFLVIHLLLDMFLVKYNEFDYLKKWKVANWRGHLTHISHLFGNFHALKDVQNMGVSNFPDYSVYADLFTFKINIFKYLLV